MENNTSLLHQILRSSDQAFTKAKGGRAMERGSPRTVKKSSVPLYESRARIMPSKRRIMDSLTLTNFNSPIPETIDFNQQSLMQLNMMSSAHGAKGHQQFTKIGNVPKNGASLHDPRRLR